MELLDTDLTKFVNKLEMKTFQKDIELSMIKNLVMAHPDFEINIENRLQGDVGQIIILIQDKRN